MKGMEKLVAYSLTDKEGVLLEVSTPFCRLVGYDREALIGQTHALIRHPETPADLYTQMWKTITQGQTWEGAIRNRTQEGEGIVMQTVIVPIVDEHRGVHGYVSFRERTYLKKEKDTPLADCEETNVIKDSVTGLLTQAHGELALKKFLEEEKRYGRSFSAVLLEIDRLVEIEQKYGIYIRDKVLRYAAVCLLENFRQADWCFRWGVKGFLVLLPETVLGSAVSASERLRQQLENGDTPLEGEVVTCSIGIVASDHETSAKLLHHLKERLEAAVHSGANRVCF